MELQFKLNSLKIPPVGQYLHSTKNKKTFLKKTIKKQKLTDKKWS